MRTRNFEFLRTDFVRGFPGFCGIETGTIDQGVFESILVVNDSHKQREGFVHAGLISTMADHTAGYAAYTIAPATHRILTIEFKINFFKPATGEKIICRSRVINPGKKIIVSESNIYSQTGTQKKQVSKATVTLMSLPDNALTAG